MIVLLYEIFFVRQKYWYIRQLSNFFRFKILLSKLKLKRLFTNGWMILGLKKKWIDTRKKRYMRTKKAKRKKKSRRDVFCDCWNKWDKKKIRYSIRHKLLQEVLTSPASLGFPLTLALLFFFFLHRGIFSHPKAGQLFHTLPGLNGFLNRETWVKIHSFLTFMYLDCTSR